MDNLDREKAIALLHAHVEAPHILVHSYALEVVMAAMARRLSPADEQLWAMTGLLHDMDYHLVDWKSDMSLHGPKTVEILRRENYGNEAMYHGILAHNGETGTPIESLLDRTIYAADPVSGFIMAVARVYPDGKLASVKVKSVEKRMNELRFAASANREAMRSIELAGVSFHEFAEISLQAMCEIADVLEM